MSFRKQIDGLTKRRNASLDAMAALSELASTEDRLFTAEEQTAWDKDQAEVADIDATLAKLQSAEDALARGARPALHPLLPNPETRAAFKPFPGQAFTRYIGALARSKGNLFQAAELSKVWDHETPEVGVVLRAAVAAGTTTDPVWAAPLVVYQNMTAEFIELLRPETVLGRLTGYRNVPFNVKIPRQTAGATAGWVGEGAPKPVSSLAFDSVTFPFAKIAVICVITQELAKFSTPAAEMLVRDDLIAAIAAFIDVQLLLDTVAAVPGLNPGSITNLAHKVPSTGATIAAITHDLITAMLYMTQPPNNVPLRRPVWIMNTATAMFLATLRTAQDVFAFPSMSTGGQPGVLGAAPTLLGIPVVMSAAVPAGDVTLLEQSELMVADDGQVVVDTSTEASLQMDSAPVPPVAATVMVSLWQQNLLGIKAERFIYWQMRRAAAAVEITGFPTA